MISALLITFVILIVIGCPIAITLGISSSVALFVGANFDLVITVQRIYTSVNSFPLMAIPFFMLGGSLMEGGGISRRIISFSDALVGHITGGLAMAGIIGCMIFASISGSAVATVAAIGGILVPEMCKRGYTKVFSSAVVSAAGTMGPIIPPSAPFVLYAAIAGVSVRDMFLGGYIPGILMGASLMVVTYFSAKKSKMPKGEKPSWSVFIRATREAFWALLTPIIIVGGIMLGVFTPTEAGAVGCVYAFLVGVFAYKELDWKITLSVLKEAAISSSVIMYLIGTASIFSWIMTVERVPQIIRVFFMGITDSPIVLLLLINLMLVVVGMLIDLTPALTMLVPVLAPLVVSYKINLVHFGVIMCVNLCIGLLTPPVGTCLFVGCRIAKIGLWELVKEIYPMIIALFIVLAIITYIPATVTFIPSLLR